MGKGKILSHLGQGKYSVELEYATSRAHEQIDLLNRNIRELQDKITTTQSERDQLESDYNDAYDDLQSTIEDLASLKPGTDEYESKLKELDKKQAAYQEAFAAYSQAIQNKRGIELEITALEKRIETINKYLKKSETIEAWCVDYSLALSGEVGTIEPAGKADQINIRPGYEGGAEYDSARDGKLSSVFNMTAAQTYYNYAMLPGARKWRPLYRTGVATGIDKENNTCDVTLDFFKFREIEGISLNLNQSSWLLDVPIDYMDCDAAVFEEYDEVVVRFEGYDWSNPKVIGFQEEPLSCGYITTLQPKTSPAEKKATLKGRVNKLGDMSAIDVHFDYIQADTFDPEESSYSNETDGQTINMPTDFEKEITNLQAYGHYHFRAVGIVEGKEVYGNDVKFFMGKPVDPILQTYIDVCSDHCLAIQMIDDEHHDNKVVVTGSEDYDEVSAVDGWYDVLMVKVNPAASAALTKNGALYYTGGPLDKKCVWEDVVHFSHGEKLLGVKKDGTVLDDPESQDSLKPGWTDIVQVSTNWGFEVGLTKYGNVLVTGSPYLGSFDEVTSWSDVIQVDTGEYEIIALHREGGVSIDGYCKSTMRLNPENFDVLSGDLDKDGAVIIGHCTLARRWVGIFEVVAGNDMVAGLTYDGMIEVSGELELLFNKDWKDIDEQDIEIEVEGENNIVSCRLRDVKNISEIAMEFNTLVAIKNDGTAIRWNGPPGIDSWSNLKVRD